MHLRRFVNLVVDSRSLPGDYRGNRAYALHRINVTDLFFRGRGRCRHADDDMEMEDAVLPLPAMVFHTTSASSADEMYFLPLAGSGDGGEVVAIDRDARALLCGAASRAVRILPDLRGFEDPIVRRRPRPFSLNVGDGLYVIDDEWPSSAETGCGFQVLTRGIRRRVYSGEDLRRQLPAGPFWQWHALAPPPFGRLISIGAYAAVGGSEIWMTVAEEHDVADQGHDDDETYSFDTATGAWRKVGDWALPFMGRAEYVAEHGLWFGLSSASGGWDADRLLTLHASDLTPGGDVWRWEGLALPSDGWSAGHKHSFLVPLGHGRFCVARSFEQDYGSGRCAVVAGVEVVRDTGAAYGLRMLLHRAKRYTLLDVYNHFCSVF
ncbi:hypothetical protein ACP4OV_022635 [Aristida adscensionis]